MLRRLHIEPLRIFKEIVDDPSKYQDLPEEVRGQVCAPKSSTESSASGDGATPGEDKNTNIEIQQLRDTIGEQHEKLSTCLKQLTKLEGFQKDSINTRAKLEERVASLDLVKDQLDNTVLRIKRKNADLEKENEELKRLTKLQRNLDQFLSEEDFSLSEILDQKSPAEQTALLFPMVHQLREENEKIRKDHIAMENRLEADKGAELSKTQELIAQIKEIQARLVKSEAKRDRYKQRLGKLNKEQIDLKQRKKQAHNPLVMNNNNSGVTKTPGLIESESKENKTHNQPFSLSGRLKPAIPLQGLKPLNQRLTSNKAGKPKGTTRKFGFGSSLSMSGFRHSTASISSGFDGRGGSSKVVINKLKRRRLGNSLF